MVIVTLLYIRVLFSCADIFLQCANIKESVAMENLHLEFSLLLQFRCHFFCSFFFFLQQMVSEENKGAMMEKMY